MALMVGLHLLMQGRLLPMVEQAERLLQLLQVVLEALAQLQEMVTSRISQEVPEEQAVQAVADQGAEVVLQRVQEIMEMAVPRLVVIRAVLVGQQ
jgi:hypothetical protein